MTDQFTYLKHRMDHLQTRVNRMEGILKPIADEDAEPSGPPGPDWRGHEKSAVPDGDLRMIEATLWSIYEFVSSESTGRSTYYKDVLEIKNKQASIEQVVSEVREGVQTIIGALAAQSG